MNLVIDVGNTLVKIAIFENGKILEKHTFIKGEFLSILAETLIRYQNITNCIVSDVGKLTEPQRIKLKSHFSVIELSHELKIPFTNGYSTPNTLGVDRIALVSAASKLYPNKNVLIIDTGSCITYDFLSDTNVYFGGAISPGIPMRYSAMHKFTSKLPLLDTHVPKDFIGNSTATSMHSGVIFGVLYEINGFVDAYSKKYDDLTVILTGGDAHFLLDSLKNDIFADSNFLLEGLNYILELNKD